MHITVEIPGYEFIESVDMGDKPMGELEDEVVTAIRNKSVLTTKTDSGRVILPPELVAKAVVRIIKKGDLKCQKH